MNPWDADIEISPQDAHKLVLDQFPPFGEDSFRLLSSGWDNDAYLVDEQFVFRFPRRKIAAKLIENEVQWLPLLASHLRLPVPISRYVGRPTEEYPYVWAGYDFMPGTTACRISWTDAERAANAKPLSEFLRGLHSVPVSDDARPHAPIDELARTDMHQRMPRIRERLAKFPEILPSIDATQIQQIAEDLVETARTNHSESHDPSSELLHWVHGDLYSRHLLADESRTICGVIDWGDVHLGDIAGDLSIAFTFLPTSAHKEFRSAYGEIDELTWDRAKFRAIAHATSITDYGHAIGDQNLLNASRFCLESILGNALKP